MVKLNKYIPMILVAAGMLSACSKGSDAPTAASKLANLNVINAVTDVKAIDFYLNGTRQNNNSAIYFLGTSGYTTVPVGTEQYQFKRDTDRALLADIQLTLPDSGARYTMLLTGQAGSSNLTSIFMHDAFTDTLTTMAKVRFVQGVPGGQNYDVFVGDTLSFKDQAFKSVTAFGRTGPGKKNVKIMLAGTSTVVASGTITVQSNSYYTFFTEGLLNGTGNDAFGAGLILSQ